MLWEQSTSPTLRALQACSLLLHRDWLLWPVSSFQVDKSFRGNSIRLNQFRGIWQSLLEGVLPASMRLGSLASSTTWYHCTELTKRWSGLENGDDGMALWPGLQACLYQRPLLHLPSPVSSQQVYELISRFPNRHYSFYFQWNITLFLELLHAFGSWLRWSLPVSRLSVFPLKLGQPFVFAEVCHYLLVTDVQPPLCWRPRKFWTAALCASRDWCKVFKAKSVLFFFFFFLFFKIEFTRNKTSSCLWGPCLLQNLQRLPAWTRPLWGLQTYLKLLEKKKWFKQGQQWS